MNYRLTGAEVLSIHFKADADDIRRAAHRARTFRDPYVYVWKGAYYCAPNERQKPPKMGVIWIPLVTIDGRQIYKGEKAA